MNENPMGRKYTPLEWAAASRQGVAKRTSNDGILIFATGPYWPAEARQRHKRALREANDWELIASAMDREWRKPLPKPNQ